MADAGPVNLDEREAAFVGQIISGRYRVGEPIATGGMGAVFRGEHLHMRKRVAIKILHAETDGILELAEQFEREAIAGAHVSHPNVAIATDFGRLDDGSFFLVQEFLRGATLAQVLEKGPLTVERTVHIAKQIAAGLHAVHAKGMVHRDVKPANVMLVEGSGDAAKLIDFGFAKVPMERMSVARADDPLRKGDNPWHRDKVFGTVGYLAPEAAQGMDAVDARSDLYALGVSIYEMLTGKRPFEADKSAELFRLHRTVPPPPFMERAPAVPIPAAIESVVMKLLAKEPAERYQTGNELIVALNRAMAGHAQPPGELPQLDVSSLELPERPRPRRGWWLGALVVVLLAGAVVWLVPAARRAVGLGASPSAVAADAAVPSAAPSPQAVDGLGAAAWTARLLAAPKAQDWQGAAKALAALGQLDPTALRSEGVNKAVLAVALGTGRLPPSDATANEIFGLLSRGFGMDGLDVLYSVVDEQPPKHPAAVRAYAELRQPEALGRASIAMRVAFELRDAPCDKKEPLFERAREGGDARALKVLKQLRSRPCRAADDVCCFRSNERLAKTIAALEAQAKKP